MSETETVTAPAVIVPVVPDVAVLEARIKAVEDEKAKLLKHNQDLAADQKKSREKAAAEKLATKELLVKAGIVDADADSDPKTVLAKHEADQRERQYRATAFEASLLRTLVGGGLTPKDGDVDLLSYRIGRDPELKALSDEGKASELVAALQAKGHVSAPSVTPIPTAATSPAPRPATGNPQVAPDTEFGTVTSWSDVLRMGASRAAAFELRFPQRAEELRSAANAHWSTPTRRPAQSPTATVMGDGSGWKTVQTYTRTEPMAAPRLGKL